MSPTLSRVGYAYEITKLLCTDIQYDEEKEEKIKQEKKQQELTAIEEAIKYAEEAKNKSKSGSQLNNCSGLGSAHFLSVLPHVKEYRRFQICASMF